MVPHVATHKTHQRLQEFSFDTPKRLLQQYLPTGDIAPTFLMTEKATMFAVVRFANSGQG